ncbi:MAG: hypothetical protein C7B44_10470 [Sulfobacillus thermosulfidooxidans]|uniref:NADH-quinone oxidoreductase subunit E n=1 Tax=Sulfobacillus thermotolerans TaxID=338644 RepID=A0ABN5H3F3_9FIRM|nr:NAD(P)H-dependent oxidoreductase subunit E [Sulfobacillus sp. hq2]AUW95227.1 hypothetical protein BXT84_15715 [Sulfobacillus thermotolerans]POB10526.1 hypothetical protein CO251_09450 [Sulfobacillus sp. hq2]PSR36164.1 MAG: hypothetical protein C7B44_10470 [Sulfobacillus thermosulfidooxidans]
MDTEGVQEVAGLLKDLPAERGQLLPALWRVVEHYHALTPALIGAVSEVLGVAYAEVYGVASFYTLFDNIEGTTPVHICTDVMCALQGAEELKAWAEQAAAGLPITVKESACLGQCDHAPAAWIGQKILRRATPQVVQEAVKAVHHG